MTYLITYDLDKPGQDYTDLIAALKKLGASRFQYSSWLLPNTQYTPMQIVNHLAQFVDGNDRLLVVAVQNYAAWRNLMIGDASEVFRRYNIVLAKTLPTLRKNLNLPP